MNEGNEINIRYLYGASVQGIQDFIFQTNKLREIVGASELVEQICTEMFDEYGRETETSVVRAAGKIIHIFENESDCKKAVLEFPKKVMTAAPGITISQSVVRMDGDYTDYEKASNELEKRLRMQRNKADRSMTLGLMAISRAPSTGLPAAENKKGVGLIDEASQKKLKNENVKSLMIEMTGNKELSPKQIAYNIEDLEGNKSWIAVIHIDGNGLGNIVQQVCKVAEDARTFSSKLDSITKSAANAAFKCACGNLANDKVIPMRPVVLGGDDVTVICRADLAVDFTKIFLEEFERESKSKFAALGEKYDVVKKGLTACAGIAFVKSSYPFHYAIHLAESLCGRAKKKAKKIDKDLAPSCLMFHKVQDSFVEEFDEIVKRELLPQPELSFEFGPYYCGEHASKFGNKCENTIDELLSNVKKLDGKEGNAIKSHIRQWLSLLFDNKESARQKMIRLRKINKQASDLIPEKYEKLENVKTIPYHDILALASILTGKGGNNE